MANYESTGRTNYVRLRNDDAYETFRQLVSLLGGRTSEKTEKGQRLIAAFTDEDGDGFSNSVRVDALLETGYVSPHAGSEFDARLYRLSPEADPADYDPIIEALQPETETWKSLGAGAELDGIDLLDEAHPLLARGQVLVFQSIGREKLRYLCGYSRAVNRTGREISVDLDDIYQLAARAFRRPQVTAAAH